MSNNRDIPIYVDLDGTLVKIDTLYQAVFMLVRREPLTILKLFGWLSKGRAYLKEQVLSRVKLNAAVLPYNQAVLDYLKVEHENGRRLILATAANHRTAQAVADHLGIFSDFISSDENTNLKGEEKLAAIKKQNDHFAYVGNSNADIPIWDFAADIILANPSDKVRRKYAHENILCLDDTKPFLKQIFKALRSQQWMKNLLIFSPMFLAHEFYNIENWIAAVMAFFSFSMAASSIYVLNDLFDLSADQHHPRKCQRPFAAGNISIEFGVLLVPLLAFLGLVLGTMVSSAFVGILLVYFLITFVYSIQLKQMAVVDVMVLALLYTLRIVAGATATETMASSWFINFAIFFFLSLALLKRTSELLEMKNGHEEENEGRERGYVVGDLPMLATFGAVSGYISVLVFTLYLSSDKVASLYTSPELLWLFTPLLLYWVSRVWILVWRGKIKDDPLAFAATDLQTYIVACLGFAIILVATFMN